MYCTTMYCTTLKMLNHCAVYHVSHAALMQGTCSVHAPCIYHGHAATVTIMFMLSLLFVVVDRFVPTDWTNKQELVLDEVNELNKLNLEFCHCLTDTATVFSPFQHGNFTCILVKEVM